MAIWLAMLAMLCHVLTPVLAQASVNPAGRNSSLMQICTTAGITLVEVAGDAGKSTPLPMKSHGGLCLYCLQQGGSDAALPPTPTSASCVPVFASAALFSISPVSTPQHTSHTFASAAPRGPPARG